MTKRSVRSSFSLYLNMLRFLFVSTLIVVFTRAADSVSISSVPTSIGYAQDIPIWIDFNLASAISSSSQNILVAEILDSNSQIAKNAQSWVGASITGRSELLIQSPFSSGSVFSLRVYAISQQNFAQNTATGWDRKFVGSTHSSSITIASSAQVGNSTVIAAGFTYVGVNAAGAEFGVVDTSEGLPIPFPFPGFHKEDYFWPKVKDLAWFARQGMNTFRVPLRWERLLPDLLNNPRATNFIREEWKRMTSLINDITGQIGAFVVLDVHNYGRFESYLIGTSRIPVSAFRVLWRELAKEFKNNDKVIFGLMNEPFNIDTEQWVVAVNQAIQGIRVDAQASNLILVPGTRWSTAANWYFTDVYGISNAEALTAVVDPGNNWAVDVHQYFDSDYSGKNPECPRPNIGASTMEGVTQWCRARGLKAFLSEFGTGSSSACLTELTGILEYMKKNSDVWFGWTYWAAGKKWPKDYFLSIEPKDGKDVPQMTTLRPYLLDPLQFKLKFRLPNQVIVLISVGAGALLVIGGCVFYCRRADKKKEQEQTKPKHKPKRKHKSSGVAGEV